MRVKDLLREKFSSESDKYYRVELFDREGFRRKKCPSCGKYFWSIKERKVCPDQPCSVYEFLGDPPSAKRFDYIEAWRQIESFFVKNGHVSAKRYPVVCRWRPDLFFTVASIIDFQRIEGNQIIFELPHNPLVVPQMCLRFNDLQNVGVSGKHFSSFCMIGQHSIADSRGYWKDRCIDLDFELLKGPFGISPDEIVFLEDVWLGYGAFGYSLEYFVRGLELGNAVFTAFKGTPDNYHEMENKVIDMGAGLERLAWITQGSPTSYDASFGPVVNSIIKTAGLTYDQELLSKYTTLVSPLDWENVYDLKQVRRSVAERIGMSASELENKITPLHAAYSLADHIRTLVFAIADGGLPSNVGGGYNLRVVLRRALGLLRTFGWDLKLEEVAEWHTSYLKSMFPELEEKKDEVNRILRVEEKRYRDSTDRMNKIISHLDQSSHVLTEEKVIELYDSEGITPDQLIEQNVKAKIPIDFYSKVTARHANPRFEANKTEFEIEGLPPTIPLFYNNPETRQFTAKIIKIINEKFVVLDKTAFFARAGGQEPDHGLIDSSAVVDVIKEGSVVLHKVGKNSFREGETVDCTVEEQRRTAITIHHTATHILNGSTKKILGSWVWQHSAFKDADKARLDVTHYSQLTDEEIIRIERLANEVVRKNIPVSVDILRRDEAEGIYGFRLYQGGVAPTNRLRIISVGDFDVEACGGTHVQATGEIGLIKIIKTERVQDGSVRLEFVAGEKAIDLGQKRDALLSQVSYALESPQEKVIETAINLKIEFENTRRRQKSLLKKFSTKFADEAIQNASQLNDVKVYVTSDRSLDEDYHITVGESAVKTDPSLVYCGLISVGTKVKLFIFSGENAQQKGVFAVELIKDVAKFFGGSGGGDAKFAQGGGGKVERINKAEENITRAVRLMLNT